MAAKEGAIMRWMLAGVAVWRTSGAANLGGIPEGWCRTNCVSGPLVQGLRLGLELIGRGAGQAKKAAQHAASWIWKATRKITDKAAEKAAKGAKALAAKAARGVQKAVRGRFRRGSDDLDQLDGVEAHKGKLKPNHRAEEGDKVRDAIDSIEKSEKRLDNRLDRVKNLKDAIDEFGE